MRPSDFRWWERWTTPTLLPSTGSPRLLDFSFPTRCLQSPRGAHRLHSSAASPMMAGFVQSGRLAAPTLCNEAESSSIALRLAGSPHRASPWGLLLSTPVWLHVGHLFDMLITFQINREASLGLAHQIAPNKRNEEAGGSSSVWSPAQWPRVVRLAGWMMKSSRRRKRVEWADRAGSALPADRTNPPPHSADFA
jgi:hypothetical protein